MPADTKRLIGDAQCQHTPYMQATVPQRRQIVQSCYNRRNVNPTMDMLFCERVLYDFAILSVCDVHLLRMHIQANRTTDITLLRLNLCTIQRNVWKEGSPYYTSCTHHPPPYLAKCMRFNFNFMYCVKCVRVVRYNGKKVKFSLCVIN
jgi:hypothetical protein